MATVPMMTAFRITVDVEIPIRWENDKNFVEVLKDIAVIQMKSNLQTTGIDITPQTNFGSITVEKGKD